jgi:predicted glycogen debranching enzyme
LFETTRLLVQQVGNEDPFVRTRLYPALIRIFERVSRGERETLWLTADGLVANGDEHVALTWMDMRTGDTPTTPRRGLAVELQALWTKGAETLAVLARQYGDRDVAEAAEHASISARGAFRGRFWCERTKYPYDCLPEDDAIGAEADDAIRPNALIALDIDPDLFERWQAAAIVDHVQTRLLTPRGVRSLDPANPAYRGVYVGPFTERRTAYHQGLAWTHLLGSYARAALRVRPGDFELAEDLRLRIDRARADCPVLGHIPQFSDGEPPYRPGGCPAQAWSVAELLRTLVWELD